MNISILQNVIANTLKCLEKHKEEHSCIIATAVFIDILKNLSPKLNHYPLTVEATILDEQQAKQFKTAQGYSGDKRIIGHRNSKSTKDLWSGHLIAIIPNIFNKTLLVDLTIHQANNFGTNIILTPISFPVTENFIKINEAVGFKNNNCYVIYRPFPNDKSYKDSSLWKDSIYRKQLSEEVLSYL